MANNPDYGGVVISGPQGCGKSSIGYLMACFSFYQKQITIYQPSMLEWTECNTEQESILKFIEDFLKLNEDIAEEIQVQVYNQEDQVQTVSLKDALTKATVRNAVDLKIILLQALRTTNYKVNFIIDEHNELFRSQNGTTPLQKFVWLSLFRSWSRLGKEDINMTYIGSAHSVFERNLPGGEEARLRYIAPPTKMEVMVMVKNPQSDLYLPGCNTEEEVEKVYWLTGGLPRELWFLRNSKDYETYAKERHRAYNHSLNNYTATLSPDERKLFELWLASALHPKRVTGQEYHHHLDFAYTAVYDRGFFFYNRPDLRCISGLAFQALIPFTASALVQRLDPVGSSEDPAVNGYLLQKWIYSFLLAGHTITLKPSSYRTSSKAIYTPVTLLAHRVFYFETEEDISSNTEAIPCIYIPRKSNYTAWDLIYDDGHTTVFLQISISHPSSHIKLIAESIQSGVVSKIVRKLRASQYRPAEGDVPPGVRFLYVSSLAENMLRPRSVSRRGSFAYNHLEVVGGNQLVSNGIKIL